MPRRDQPVVALVGIIVAQGKDDRDIAEGVADLGGEKGHGLMDEGTECFRIFFSVEFVELFWKMVGQDVTRENDRLSFSQVLGSFIQSLFQKRIVGFLSPGGKIDDTGGLKNINPFSRRSVDQVVKNSRIVKGGEMKIGDDEERQFRR